MHFVRVNDDHVNFRASREEKAELARLLRCSKAINTVEYAGIDSERIDQLAAAIETVTSSEDSYEIPTSDLDDVFALLSAMRALSTDTERFEGVTQERFQLILSSIEMIHTQQLVTRVPDYK